jgi:uncharacterized GH25 family protein
LESNVKSLAVSLGCVVTHVAGSAVGLAHDYWIEPARFRAPVAESVAFDLKVGFAEEVDVLPWQPHHCERAVAVLGDAEFEFTGESGRTPAFDLAFASEGTWTLGYRSFESRVELDAEKFEAYLREEGLDRIIAERAERRESAKSGRELFSRCAKALIAVGAPRGSDRPGPRAIGQTLELVAELDPYTLSEGAKLPVTLLLRGKPLAGALVEAVRMDPSHRTIGARSDANGRVEFDLEPGPWMITAVEMERAPKGPLADWRSLWATLTFERAAPGDTVAATQETSMPQSPKDESKR